MGLELFVVAFACGALAKLTDVQTDRKLFFFPRAQYVTGALYGIAGGLLLALNAQFTNLFFGVLAGVVLTGKIDRFAHRIAIAAVLLVLAFLGLPQGISFPLVLLFTLAAGFDERLNDWSETRENNGKRVPRILAFIGENRLSLELVSLLLGIATGQWLYLLATLSFDVGYLGLSKLFKETPGATGSLGNHLAIDLFDCPPSRLSDEKSVEQFLTHFSKQMGMKMLTRPVVKRVKLAHDEGLSGFVVIAESHISVHTFPRIHSCNVDLFSCKDFDSQKASADVAKWFKARVVKIHSLERGEAF